MCVPYIVFIYWSMLLSTILGMTDQHEVRPVAKTRCFHCYDPCPCRPSRVGPSLARPSRVANSRQISRRLQGLPTWLPSLRLWQPVIHPKQAGPAEQQIRNQSLELIRSHQSDWIHGDSWFHLCFKFMGGVENHDR